MSDPLTTDIRETKLGPRGCDCCDPTSDSPDPVVVRLERELAEAEHEFRECEDEYKKWLKEEREDNARLRGLLREGHDNFPPSWEWRSKVAAALEGKP